LDESHGSYAESNELSNPLEKGSPWTSLENSWQWYPQHLEVVHKTDGTFGEFLANQGRGLVGIVVPTVVSCVADGLV
jgi:hypothetical protein